MDNNVTKKIIHNLNIKEKLSLLAGKNYWTSRSIKEIISLTMADGPHGIRKQCGEIGTSNFNKSFPSIAFPTASCSACSFDKNLLFLEGQSIAHEAKRLNVDIVLGPGLNIKRSPLCGRNFEYFSEDPYLCGELAASLTKGIQSEGISSCVKHFAANNQEKYRFVENSIIDERTLHETYLFSFKTVIEKSSPDAIMTSYNMVNGIYSSESKYLLKDYLRNRLKFNGLIITDWGAISNPIASFKNGLNLEMPGVDKSRQKYLLRDFKKGLISENEINQAITPLVNLSVRHKERHESNKDISDSMNHDLNISEEIATNSIVLAKNKDQILPLSESERLLIVGSFALNGRYQGSGSSLINPIENDSFLQVMDDNLVSYEFAPGYSLNDNEDSKNLIEQACSLAKFYEKVILFLGLPSEYEGEGFDKKSLSLPTSQLKLVSELIKLHKKIIVVVEAGSPVSLPFIDDIDALFIPYLGGCRVNRSLYKLIFGIVSPSGRLAETYPLYNEELPISDFGKAGKDVLYREGQFVGYKNYIYFDKKVLFPFGYGITYSHFSYSNIKIAKDFVSFDIKNDGNYSAKEVIQIYISNKKEGKIYKSLKYFDKVTLLKNEIKHFDIPLSKEMFSFYSIKKHDFVLGTGEFFISLSTSATNDIYTEKIIINGEENFSFPDYDINFDNITIRKNNIKGFYDINSSLYDLCSCRLGRFLYKKSNKLINKIAKNDPSSEKMMRPMLQEGPLRILVMGSNGALSLHQVMGIIDILNGHFFKGLHKLIHK